MQVAADSCVSIHGHGRKLSRRRLVVAVQSTAVSTSFTCMETSQIIHAQPKFTSSSYIFILEMLLLGGHNVELVGFLFCHVGIHLFDMRVRRLIQPGSVPVAGVNSALHL